jgi:hypothetical protein
MRNTTLPALVIGGAAKVNALIRLGAFRSTLDVRRLARHSFSEGWFGVRSSSFEPGLTPFAIGYRPFGDFRSTFEVGRSMFDVHLSHA